MIDKKDVLIVLPAYNESKTIINVIEGIRYQGYDNILVIDDCSTDSTKDILKKNNVTFLHHIINRGAGAATNTGITYAKNKKYNYLVLMDSDGQHNPEDIHKIVKALENYDTVIGSRMLMYSNKMPISRKIANYIGSILTFIIYGIYIRDSQSGFRGFSKKAIDKINITNDRFEFCSEMSGEIHKYGLKYKEIPIEVIYTKESLKKGQSIKNGFKMLFRLIIS